MGLLARDAEFASGSATRGAVSPPANSVSRAPKKQNRELRGLGVPLSDVIAVTLMAKGQPNRPSLSLQKGAKAKSDGSNLFFNEMN